MSILGGNMYILHMYTHVVIRKQFSENSLLNVCILLCIIAGICPFLLHVI